MTRALVAATLAGVLLVGAYLALGGGGFEPRRPAAACAQRALPGGEGVTDTLQRVGLVALERVACDLGVSRERLLLVLAGRADARLDRERTTDAFRDGLRAGLDEEVRAGRLGETQAFLLRQGIELLPLETLIDRLLGG